MDNDEPVTLITGLVGPAPDLGVTLFAENWLAMDEKWLKIDLSQLGVNKMTWLDLEQKQLKNWLGLEQIQYMHRTYVYIITESWSWPVETECSNP